MLSKQGVSEAKLATVEAGNYSEWLQVAGHGIFSYDYVHWVNVCRFVAIPLQPILLFTWPKVIQETVTRIQIGVDGFVNAPLIDFSLISLSERM